jgi:hypothetical protein
LRALAIFFSISVTPSQQNKLRGLNHDSGAMPIKYKVVDMVVIEMRALCTLQNTKVTAETIYTYCSLSVLT